jgi:hypothetical protein
MTWNTCHQPAALASARPYSSDALSAGRCSATVAWYRRSRASCTSSGSAARTPHQAVDQALRERSATARIEINEVEHAARAAALRRVDIALANSK